MLVQLHIPSIHAISATNAPTLHQCIRIYGYVMSVIWNKFTKTVKSTCHWVNISNKMEKKMDKKPAKKAEASSSTAGPSSEMPKVFTALCRDPKYRKANAEFLTRRLRLEFDKLTTTRPLCKASAAPREFYLPPELKKCHQSNFRSNTKKSRKRSSTLNI